MRSEKGLKQSELGKIIGVKTNTISNYENDVSQPDFETLDKIVKHFDIGSHELLFTDISTLKFGSYKERENDASVLSEPGNDSTGYPIEECKNCTGKERIIKAMQLTIDELLADKNYLKEEIKELKEKLKK